MVRSKPWIDLSESFSVARFHFFKDLPTDLDKLSISFLAFVAFFLLPVAAVRVLSVDDEGNRELESKSYVVDGSCSYNNPWSGASCMEFRGNDQSS